MYTEDQSSIIGIPLQDCFVTYILPADRKYFAQLEFNTALHAMSKNVTFGKECNYTILSIGPGMINNNCFFFPATFDVKNVVVTQDSSEAVITGNFITNSSAKGLFLVLHSDDGSPDKFRTLLRGDREESLSNSITVPPSTYSVLVYDVEENGLPNSIPVFVIRDKQLTMTTGRSFKHRC